MLLPRAGLPLGDISAEFMILDTLAFYGGVLGLGA